ncbi:MAG TPA: hypothetical protein VD970_10565 [Acetobacteraceae bacterium]|nr:hypothetical protein [Acetobacteraceae bacterium]
MIRRLAVPALIAPLLAGPAGAQPAPQASLQDCSPVEAAGTAGRMEVAAVGLAFAGEGNERHVAAAQPRSAAGQSPTTRTTLAPVRPGVSFGATLEAMPGGSHQASFTMATVEQAGTVLLETWSWGPTGPQGHPPEYRWARVRCGA